MVTIRRLRCLFIYMKTKISFKTVICTIIIILFLSLCFVSCKTQTVYVPQVRDSLVYQNRTDSLTIYRHDSIFIRQTGDTVLVEKYRNLVVYRSKTDTVYQKIYEKEPYPVKGDTVTKAVVPRWCWYLLIGAIGYLIYQIVRWKIKK